MTRLIVRADRARLHLTLIILGLAGIVALFLPFTFGVTPLQAGLDWELWDLVLPAFLPVVIVAASAHWLSTGTLSRPERIAGYLLGLGSAAATIVALLRGEVGSSGLYGWLALGAPVLILGFGAMLVVRDLGAGRRSEFTPIMAMQVAYLANAMYALIASFRDLELGAYCVLATVVAYALQIHLVRKAPAGNQE